MQVNEHVCNVCINFHDIPPVINNFVDLYLECIIKIVINI